ncbi:MAG: PspC domain-containing protein [Methanomicrobiales archaeon]|nr:PspC domain-containing protein [Methanomicrobiales archaeon]
MQRIYRSRNERVLAGVCGGIGVAADVDPSLVRLAWVVLSLLSMGAGILLYLAAWLIIPEEPEPGAWQASPETPAVPGNESPR